jgi:hypothetical protein
MNTLETHTITPFVGPPLPMERITSHALYRAVRWTEAAGVPTAPRRPRGAKLAGLQYERRVLDVLTAIYGGAFREQANIAYWDRRGPRRAVLDGVLRLGDEVLIIEVKLAHTARIWEQLVERYVPLVKALEPGATVRGVEICRSYDPHVKLLGPHKKITSLHQAASGGLEVLQWRI